MAKRIHARLTPREGRRFGLTVGGAFLAVAAVGWWRGHPWWGAAAGAVGALSVLAGVLAPGRLGPIHRGWMRLGAALSAVTTPLFLGVVYFCVIAPAGFLLRLTGHHPLGHAKDPDSLWVERDPAGRGPDHMQHQF